MNPKGNGIIVTGGGSGLGAATAAYLAARGAKVCVVDLNTAAAQKVADTIGGTAIACDVADAEQGELAVSQAVEAVGSIRVLVNCAGIGTAGRIVGREGPMALADFERVIKVNLIGSFNMMRLAAAHMSGLDPLEDGERGVIVSTASVAAQDGQVGQAAYAASKGGIQALALPAARELARFGIRVMTIAPGLFRTPLMESLPEDIQQSLAASIPFPSRLGEPDEFAGMVEHCITNMSLNGEMIRLDGALRLPPR